MRFLLDQNLRVQTKRFLQQLGHDVIDTRDLELERATIKGALVVLDNIKVRIRKQGM